MAIKCTALTNNIQDIFAIPAKVDNDEPDNIKAITTMVFCNKRIYNSNDPTANSDSLRVYAVPNNDISDFTLNPDNYLLINYLEIPAGETFTFDTERMTLANGDSIKAVCVSNRIVCTVSSVDLT